MIEPLIEAMLLLFVRISSFVAFMPLYGGGSIPRTVKVGLAVALTAFWSIRFAPSIAPTLADQGNSSWLMLTWMIGREATLGAAMGWILGLVLVPVRIAGAYIAQEMGLTIATLTSSTGEANSNVLSEILDALAVLVFLSVDAHHLFFRAAGASFRVFPVGTAWSLPKNSWITKSIADTPAIGLHMAAPVVMLLFGTTLGLLFIMRQTPQFNLFNFGMPVRLIAGLVALFLFIPDLIMYTTVMVQRWFSVF